MQTNFSLAHQNPLYIKAHQSMLNATALDDSYAEMMYRVNLLDYKTSFSEFCKRNHYQIVMDSIKKEDVPQGVKDFCDATMRYSYDISKAEDYINWDF